MLPEAKRTGHIISGIIIGECIRAVGLIFYLRDQPRTGKKGHVLIGRRNEKVF